MNKYKVAMRFLAHKKNENGEDAHFVVNGGFKKGQPIIRLVDVYKRETGLVKDNLSFQEAKKVRNENKGSYIVKM